MSSCCLTPAEHRENLVDPEAMLCLALLFLSFPSGHCCPLPPVSCSSLASVWPWAGLSVAHPSAGKKTGAEGSLLLNRGDACPCIPLLCPCCHSSGFGPWAIKPLVLGAALKSPLILFIFAAWKTRNRSPAGAMGWMDPQAERSRRNPGGQARMPPGFGGGALPWAGCCGEEKGPFHAHTEPLLA